MREETVKNIDNYLGAHNLLSLATISVEGLPMAHSVEYINEGHTVFFISHRGTRKIANIKQNSKVAYTVDEDYQDWSLIQGIQMMGHASFVEDKEEAGRLMGIYMNKFPQVANFPAEMVNEMRLVKIEPFSARYIDSTKGMGYTETIEY
ncbi:pyridoxamine 5'-phosphate oxidase family protein [Labilibaculum sp.]|uniref:pyridoxamine 5'-phosphate oxidase family protein n=1 Tax=Labilibaculum sp. TaxID=2060723 RepID=UPI00356AC40D